MVGVVAAVAILVIFSDIALQEWAQVLRRDAEAEMMFRAQDIVRAIQRYRRDHGGAPPMKLEDLMQPGPRNQYYLRQMWKDPLVKDGKWGLLYAGPSGEIVDPNAPQEGDPTATQGNSPFGQPFGGKPFGSPSPGGGAFGDPQASPEPGNGLPGGGLQGGNQGLPGLQGGNSTPFGISGGGEDKNAGGKQLAGLPIAGVRTLCDDDPFRVYNGMTEYEKWLFTYFDLERAQVPGGNRAPGARQNPNAGSPFGQQPGGSPFGGKAPGFGNSRRGNNRRPPPKPGG